MTFLLQPPTMTVTLPPELIYEEEKENKIAQAERERQLVNAQLKVEWRNKFAKITAHGMLCGDNLWENADPKAASLSFLSLRVEGRHVFKRKSLSGNADEITTKHLWEAMDIAFARQLNITIDRYQFLMKKRQNTESVVFFGSLRELANNCDFGDNED